MNVHCSPERVSEVATDLASREKAFAVNCGIIARQNGADLLASLGTADAQTRATAATLIETLAAGPAWPRTLRRDLAAMIRALARMIGSGRPDADDVETLAWHLARLRELSAQLTRIDATATLLAMLRSIALPHAFRRSEALRARKSGR